MAVSWEIQELNSGNSVAVSYADGRQYPWYGITSECRTVRSPSEGGKVKVNMNDNFNPTMSWAIPVGREQPDTLTAVHHDQSFLVWLVAKNKINGDILALRVFHWRAVVNITGPPLNCTCPTVSLASSNICAMWDLQTTDMMFLLFPYALHFLSEQRKCISGLE